MKGKPAKEQRRKKKRAPKKGDEKPEPKLRPVGTRIGEGASNLARRAEWFQRRTSHDD